MAPRRLQDGLIVTRHFGTHPDAQEDPLEVPWKPSWRSKLFGSRRFKEMCILSKRNAFCFIGGVLKEEAKPSKAEKPQADAKGAQQLVQRGSTPIIAGGTLVPDLPGGVVLIRNSTHQNTLCPKSPANH